MAIEQAKEIKTQLESEVKSSFRCATTSFRIWLEERVPGGGVATRPLVLPTVVVAAEALASISS